MCVGSVAFATRSPIPKWVQKDFVPSDLKDQGTDGEHLPRIVRFTWDFAIEGGATGSTALGQTLPAGALIRKNYFFIETAPAWTGDAGTIGFECEDSANLLALVDLSGAAASSFQTGVATGDVSDMFGSIAANCDISVQISAAAHTAGKIIGWIEYVEGD